MEEVHINANFKDRLFSFIFGNEKNKKWSLELYNAVNKTHYTNPDDIEINTLTDSNLYMGMRNDVSFLLNCSLNLYEHQSSYNPNMPIRQLIYMAKIYDKYIKAQNLNIYGSSRLKLPVPKLVTFYNGLKGVEDETILELKDLLHSEVEGMVPDVDVRVRMLNVNYGHNKELMEACRPLYEYSWFVHTIRENCAKMDIKEAVNRALDDMPDSFSIKSFLMENRSEVEMSCLTEYDEAKTMNQFKEEGRAEGLAEGREEGRAEGKTFELLSLVKDGILTSDIAAGRLNISVAEFEKLYNQWNETK